MPPWGGFFVSADALRAGTRASATASASNATAVGQGASAQATGSVALGNGSIATDTNTVSVGAQATGLTRRIENVGAGVNLAQMQASDLSTLDTAEAYTRGLLGPINGRISDAFASGAAMAAMYGTCSRSEGDNCLAVGTGADNGHGAVAVGYRHTIGGFKSRLSWDLGLSASGHDTTVAAGISVSW